MTVATPPVVRRPAWNDEEDAADRLLENEWLVTNGLGGYATGTVHGVATRRYHGFLVAALPRPLGRVVLLNQIAHELRLPSGETVPLHGDGRPESLSMPAARTLAEFRLEMGLPVWVYRTNGVVLEKRVFMPHQQNTTFIRYRVLEAAHEVELRLSPRVHFRSHESPVNEAIAGDYTLRVEGDRYEIAGREELPPLRLALEGESSFTVEPRLLTEFVYPVESERGYEYEGNLWTPGHFCARIEPGGSAALVASAEAWEAVRALSADEALEAETGRRERLLEMAPAAARRGFPAELVLAADQFVIEPAGRREDAARAHAEGDEVRTVIAGYHWFTDWGRDTMISLEGLTLATGRPREAGYILRTFAHYVRDGLIPNLFPDTANDGLYHTADATPWFFHAVDRYLTATNDRRTLRRLIPTLQEIVRRHLEGTRFGIGVDDADGLIRQGEEGYQLTWMDAKVDGWVVTPRRGKVVEINALWYNALRLLAQWLREEDGEEGADGWADGISADELTRHAERAYESFNRRFWYEEGGHLFDLVDGEDGDDPACRPNQIFAMSLRHPVLAEERWRPVLETVQERLLTPVGLRSLAQDHPDYRPNYHGDLRTRDGAYHQGTVWGWLIGPFVDAWLRVHPEDRRGARRFLEGFERHLDEFGVGSIAEIFDAEEPFTPRGCIAQAWSVAEVLRCWLKTED
jgi:predicted glycogen debranching enzyme